jgi:hypothetical protein
MSEVGKETEANGGHRGDQTLNRTWSLHDRTRLVSVQCLRVFQFDDRTRSASGHSRSDASGRSGSLLDSNQTLALWRPIISPARPVVVSLSAAQVTNASGHSWDQCVRSFVARSVYASSASGRCFTVSHCATGASGQLDQRVRSVLRVLAVARPARPVSWTSASGQRDFSCLSF